MPPAAVLRVQKPPGVHHPYILLCCVPAAMWPLELIVVILDIDYESTKSVVDMDNMCLGNF